MRSNSFFQSVWATQPKRPGIEKQWLRKDTLIKGGGADKVFDHTYRIISRLYRVIDCNGGAEAAAAA